MSLLNLQAAVAHLIRVPVRSRSEDLILYLIGKYKLQQEHEATFKHLAQDKRLYKYGTDLRDVRWRRIRNAIPTPVKRCLDDSLLKEYYYQNFDCSSSQMAYDDVVPEFLNMLSDHLAKGLIYSEYPFAADVLVFERFQLLFKKRRIPETLRGIGCRTFEVLSLHHDVVSFSLSCRKAEAFSNAPKKDLNIVMISWDQSPMGYKLFAVDLTTADDLRAFKKKILESQNITLDEKFTSVLANLGIISKLSPITENLGSL